MRIYCGIDGTKNNDPTPLGSAVVDPAQLTSFVKRISLLGFDESHYIPGPAWGITGWDSAAIAYKAFSWIMLRIRRSQTVAPRIFLGGFSRGGAVAINLAYKLKELGYTVDGLFLFDAVDRTYAIPNGTVNVIPNNVRKSFHAMRDSQGDSRPEFGNCGTSAANNNLSCRYFKCTHGGMGGWRFGGGESVTRLKMQKHEAHLPVANSTAAYRLPQRVIVEPRTALFHHATKVSPLQELSVSLSVWNWMEGHVRAT